MSRSVNVYAWSKLSYTSYSISWCTSLAMRSSVLDLKAGLQGWCFEYHSVSHSAVNDTCFINVDNVPCRTVIGTLQNRSLDLVNLSNLSVERVYSALYHIRHSNWPFCSWSGLSRKGSGSSMFSCDPLCQLSDPWKNKVDFGSCRRSTWYPLKLCAIPLLWLQCPILTASSRRC